MNLINFDTNKTLADLESGGRSSMVSRAQKLRQKPVKELTVQELRMMISQNSSLKFLVPLAIAKLNVDSLVKGENYAGDLLNAVLTVEKKFWGNDLSGYIPMLQSLIDSALKLANSNQEQYKSFLSNCNGAINIFRANVGLK